MQNNKRQRNRRPRRNRKRAPARSRMYNKVKAARSANLKTDVHYLSRYAGAVDVSTISTLTSSWGGFLEFSLGQVPNSTDFSNLFDSYRLMGVLLTFRLMDNPDSTNYINSTTFTQGSNFYPKLWWCIDRDDSTTPTLASIRERSTAKCLVLRPDRFIKVLVKYPRPMIQAYSGGYMQAPVSWLRTNEPNTPHYGLKVVLDKMGYSGTTFTVGIDKKYFFTFKHSK